ncbi:MAG TPA: VTT domain-containing protein [Micromonospora sp.]|nr:VTT domain-containing protein [Micromonospora sp.]
MTTSQQGPPAPSKARFAVLLLLLVGFGLTVLLLPRPDLDRVPQLLDRLGPLAPVAPVLVGATLLIALVPRTFVTLAWGALFGPLGGAGYALAAALLAAALGFGIGRLLGRDFVSSHSSTAGENPCSTASDTGGGRAKLTERLRSRLARLDGWFSRTSLLGVIAVRLLPIGGFGLLSYGYGTTGARFGPYLGGSAIASTPSAFGYAAVGAAAVSPQHVTWLAVAPAILGLAAMAVLVARSWCSINAVRGPR